MLKNKPVMRKGGGKIAGWSGKETAAKMLLIFSPLDCQQDKLPIKVVPITKLPQVPQNSYSILLVPLSQMYVDNTEFAS